MFLSWQQNTVFDLLLISGIRKQLWKVQKHGATTFFKNFRSFCSLTLNQCNRPRLQNSNNLMIQKSTFASLNSAWRWNWQNVAVSVYANFNCFASDFWKKSRSNFRFACTMCVLSQSLFWESWKSLGLDNLLVHWQINLEAKFVFNAIVLSWF